jgi:NAD-dependent deacetylase sirtuin 4
MRIPYTEALPLPRIIPAYANNASTAVSALVEFLNAPTPSIPSASQSATLAAARAVGISSGDVQGKTLLLTGAGISVASGLADYRGKNGTYTLNKTYRPIYYHEFVKDHEARKRYWARSFLGWTNLEKATANRGHEAVKKLWELGRVGGVITQSMFSPCVLGLVVEVEGRIQISWTNQISK